MDKAVPRPDPDVIRLVQFSSQRLYSQQVLMIEHFRETLHQLVPEVQRLAVQREQELSEQLVRSVLWSALAPDPAPDIERALRRVGSDNQRRGFPREGYLGVGHALLRSARTVSDTGWSSELSSAWVAYYAWLAGQLKAGADAADEPSGEQPPREAGGQHAPSLEAVLEALRTRHFPDDARGLDAICTRVMLATGADLRAPRPDQLHDPVVLSEVVTVLTIMGYSPAAPVPAARIVPGADDADPLDRLVRAREPGARPRRRRRFRFLSRGENR